MLSRLVLGLVCGRDCEGVGASRLTGFIDRLQQLVLVGGVVHRIVLRV